MRAESKPSEPLFVSVFEIERGLFHATYRSTENTAAVRRLPPYQVGSCIADAKARIALSAQASGYETIIWDDSEPPLDGMPADGAAPMGQRPS